VNENSSENVLEDHTLSEPNSNAAVGGVFDAPPVEQTPNASALSGGDRVKANVARQINGVKVCAENGKIDDCSIAASVSTRCSANVWTVSTRGNRHF
jgi:hypothetical protein